MRNKTVLFSSLLLLTASTLSSCNKKQVFNVTKCNLGNAISLMTESNNAQSFKTLKSNGQSNDDLLGAINKIDPDCNITELEFTDDAGNVQKLLRPSLTPISDRYVMICFQAPGTTTKGNYIF